MNSSKKHESLSTDVWKAWACIASNEDFMTLITEDNKSQSNTQQDYEGSFYDTDAASGIQINVPLNI